MAAFRLTAKRNCGSGKAFLSKGAVLNISKSSSALPGPKDIKEAIKNQYGIDFNVAPSRGNFDVEKL